MINNNSVIIEGMTSIKAVIDSQKNTCHRNIIEIYYDKDILNEKEKSGRISYLEEQSKKYDFAITGCDSSLIDETANGKTHGGIIAICSGRTVPELEAEIIKKDGIYYMLDGIEDPYNFGYAVRTLYALGCDGIVIPKRNWMSAADVVCRSSAGASELAETYVSDTISACELFKGKGYKIISAGIRESVPLAEADLVKPVFTIVGGEKRGISRKILDLSDQIVRIDYDSKFRGSLSTVSALSIIAYEIRDKNQSTGF